VLTGHGRFFDDLKLADQLHAAIVRSPHAHADITGRLFRKALAEDWLKMIGGHSDRALLPTPRPDSLLSGTMASAATCTYENPGFIVAAVFCVDTAGEEKLVALLRTMLMAIEVRHGIID
jgi:CO/xanthine dehydrogenase Mo-binding subunit